VLQFQRAPTHHDHDRLVCDGRTPPPTLLYYHVYHKQTVYVLRFYCMSIIASLASRSRKRIGHSACATQPPNMCASAAPAHLMTASPYALRRVGTRPRHLHSTSTVPSCPKPVTPLKAYPTIPRSELYPRPTAHRLPSTSTSPDTNRRHCWKEIL